MQQKIEGGCHCGAVRFAVTTEPMMQILCFCTDCQQISGAASYAAYIVPLDQIELTSGGTQDYTVLSDQGRRNTRRFCATCGSRLWAELEIGLASVNGMALDDRTHFVPTHNHRLVTAPAWCQIDSGLEDLPASE
ncbi:MAG: GFA family protein [Pseudomonadota bacterium]